MKLTKWMLMAIFSLCEIAAAGIMAFIGYQTFKDLGNDYWFLLLDVVIVVGLVKDSIGWSRRNPFKQARR